MKGLLIVGNNVLRLNCCCSGYGVDLRDRKCFVIIGSIKVQVISMCVSLYTTVTQNKKELVFVIVLIITFVIQVKQNTFRELDGFLGLWSPEK